MDFYTLLPPEIALVIALHLDLGSIACCLLVCRQWNNVLSSLEPYWRQACTKLGLSDNLMEHLVDRYDSTKRVAFAADRQRRILLESPYVSTSVTAGYPYNVHYVCNSVKDNILVGTVYKDFKPCGIVIKTIGRTSVSRTVIDPKFSMIAENRTYWTRIVSNTLVHVTSSGLWSIYDLNRNGVLLVQWRGAAIFDSEVKIAICDTCHSICTAKLVSSHSLPAYWDLRVISPSTNIDAQNSRPTTLRFKVEAETHCSGVKQTTKCKKSVLIFPLTTRINSRGACTQHSVLLQCGRTVYSYKLFGDDQDSNSDKLSYSPKYNLSVNVETDAVLHKNCGLSTEIVLSKNQELLGMVFQSQIIVWEKRTSKLLSVADIELETYAHEQIQLVALGRVYSLIGLEFATSLLVIITSTGQIVREFSDFAERHIPLVPPYIEYLGALQDSWLSDVTHTPTSALPTLVYWNKTNRAVEGISFGRDSEGRVGEEIVSTQRRAWWKFW